MAEKPINDYGFEQFLNEGKLMGSRCNVCETALRAAAFALSAMPPFRDGMDGDSGRGDACRFYFHLYRHTRDDQRGI